MTDYTCERISTPLGRFYRSPTTKLWYPSVTTVVNDKDKEFFEQWRKDPANKKSSEESCEYGTRLHTNMENYISGKEIVYKDEIDLDHIDNIKHVKDSISDIVVQEKVLYSDELRIAGQVDLIAKYNGINSIIDYKTSRKRKMREWIHNYFDQAFCYSFMGEELLNVRTPQLVIIISVKDSGSDIFIEKTRDCAKHYLETSRNYWKNRDFIKIQDACEEYYHKEKQI